MKRLLAACLALVCAGWMASALLAASALAEPPRTDGVQDAGSPYALGKVGRGYGSPETAFPVGPKGSVLPASSAPKLDPQLSSTNYALDWSAVGEISGGASASAGYKLNATIGQMAANTSSLSASYGLCTGFECVANTLLLYLPLIRR